MDEISARILIVDDEPELRQILLHFVEMIGFQADEVENGELALKRLEDGDYDVVLSDLVMPKLDGLGLLRKLNERNWRKPFILLTGHGSEELARQALQLGAYDFVDKPFDHKHLKTILQGAARLSKEQLPFDAPQVAASDDERGIPTFDFTRLILNNDTSRAAKQAFIDQSTDVLTFCKAAVKNLEDGEARKFELGYLLRVMRDMTTRAQQCGFFDLSAFTAMATECLIYYRSRPEVLKQADISLFTDLVHFLLKYLQVIDNEKSIQYLFSQMMERMDVLCQTFGHPDDYSSSSKAS